MTTFLAVVAVGAVVLVMCGLLFWPIFAWTVLEDWSIWAKVGNTIGALLAMAAIIALAIDSGALSDNNAEHCGPGTRYVSESHYNPATKTTITDWMCTV